MAPKTTNTALGGTKRDRDAKGRLLKYYSSSILDPIPIMPPFQPIIFPDLQPVTSAEIKACQTAIEIANHVGGVVYTADDIVGWQQKKDRSNIELDGKVFERRQDAVHEACAPDGELQHSMQNAQMLTTITGLLHHMSQAVKCPVKGCKWRRDARQGGDTNEDVLRAGEHAWRQPRN